MNVANAPDVRAGMLGWELGDAAAALPLKREELAIFRQLLRPNDVRLAHAGFGLAQTLSELGPHEEAVQKET